MILQSTCLIGFTFACWRIKCAPQVWLILLQPRKTSVNNNLIINYRSKRCIFFLPHNLKATQLNVGIRFKWFKIFNLKKYIALSFFILVGYVRQLPWEHKLLTDRINWWKILKSGLCLVLALFFSGGFFPSLPQVCMQLVYFNEYSNVNVYIVQVKCKSVQCCNNYRL